MSRELKPAFSTNQSDFTFTLASGDFVNHIYNGELIKNNDPPSAQYIGSVAISNDGTGASAPAVVITPKMQLWFGSNVGYGVLHTLNDENGSPISFDTDSDETVEANIYQQDWWKECEGFRVVLSRSGASSLGGNACVIIK